MNVDSLECIFFTATARYLGEESRGDELLPRPATQVVKVVIYTIEITFANVGDIYALVEGLLSIK